MLDHQSPTVRFEATRAAGELEISDAAPRLIELLDDTDDDIRLAAAWSLSQVGGEGVREKLEKLLKDSTYPEEAGVLQDAIDNLIFNEELDLFGLMDLTEDDF
jgi:HEAT repeat protein